MNHFSNKLIVKDPFEMPAVDDTTVLVLRECVDLVPHCWVWNESVGYLEVVTYSGYDIYVTVKNVGMKENATSGTIFPSCMEFLITAPNATPIIDNTVTCLRADFKCPTVGQEALMSVDSTSAIRVGDIIIVDTRYQYLVTEIINEHTMKVLNEEKGKEGGVIDVKCNECVPVKILESTHCCEALQDQVDDIYSRIDTKKSIIPDSDSLISVTNGSNSLTDANNDVVLDVDTDLSKYDNTTSQFITLADVPPSITYTASAPLSIDSNNNISITQASDTADGYMSSYMFRYIHDGFERLSRLYLEFDEPNLLWDLYVEPGDGNDTILGGYTPFARGYINTLYTNAIVLNGTTYTSIPTVNDATLTIQKNGTSVGTFTANASSNSTVNITVPTDTNDLTNGAGYITSASLPTVNDATLTIYESDGITPFVSFSANAASNVTATLPQSGTNLIYFEESLSGTTATFQSKSGSATTFNLGSSSRWFSDSYVENSRVKTLIGQNYVDGITYSSSNSIGHTVIYDAGTTSQSSGRHEFRSGGATILSITEDGETVATGDIVPVSDNNVLLGYNGKSFEEGWINEIHTQNIFPTTGNTSINIGGNLIPGSSTEDLGSSQNKFSKIYSTDLYIENLYSSGSTIYLQNSFRDSGPGAHNLGDNSSHYFAGVYSAGFVQVPSDIREKENIENYKSSVLDKLDKLNPISYTFKGSDDKSIKLGLSAQELKEIEPLCVVGSETKSSEKLGVDLYATLTLAMQAIKELSAEVKELKSKLGEKDADSKVLEK